MGTNEPQTTAICPRAYALVKSPISSMSRTSGSAPPQGVDDRETVSPRALSRAATSLKRSGCRGARINPTLGNVCLTSRQALRMMFFAGVGAADHDERPTW